MRLGVVAESAAVDSLALADAERRLGRRYRRGLHRGEHPPDQSQQGGEPEPGSEPARFRTHGDHLRPRAWTADLSGFLPGSGHVRWPGCGRQLPGKNRSISRLADSSESEACTRFSRLELARSPRVLPGAAVRASVAPTIARTTSTTRSPSTIMATIGPEVMTSRNSGYHALPRCSA